MLFVRSLRNLKLIETKQLPIPKPTRLIGLDIAKLLKDPSPLLFSFNPNPLNLRFAPYQNEIV